MQQQFVPKVLHKIYLGTFVFSPSSQSQFSYLFRGKQIFVEAHHRVPRLLAAAQYLRQLNILTFKWRYK
jgi:hypothetical protein